MLKLISFFYGIVLQLLSFHLCKAVEAGHSIGQLGEYITLFGIKYYEKAITVPKLMMMMMTLLVSR